MYYVCNIIDKTSLIFPFELKSPLFNYLVNDLVQVNARVHPKLLKWNFGTLLSYMNEYEIHFHFSVPKYVSSIHLAFLLLFALF